MTTQEVKREPATILSGDVKGYSRLLVRDEAGTIRTLNTYKEVMASLIQSHGGKVIDAPADHVLAEFSSVMDAVQCAVEIQKKLKSRNDELPEPRRVEFRFGINLGEVLKKEEIIFGDGVNIAVRIQSFADAGGICLSGVVYEQIKDKLKFRYDYIGKQTVKNAAESVRIYKVLREGETVSFVDKWKRIGLNYWKRFHLAVTIIVALVAAANGIWQLYPRIFPHSAQVASKVKMAFSLPDKPSIAVMPFVNMSEDPKQDLFSEGMTVEIGNALSKVPQVFIIASNSTSVYKGKTTNARQVAEDLGVQYVLEGSVRRSGDEVRVTVQLIDAVKGYHLWSERYDRNVKDIFALQDEITMKILTEFRVKLTDGEVARMYAKGTKNLQAYLKVLEGDGYMRQYNKESNAVAMRLYREAMALDPNYAMVYIRLSRALTTDLHLGAGGLPEETLSYAMKLAQKAVKLDNSSAEAYAAVSNVFLMMRQHDKAIEVGKRAVRLDPNSASALFTLGTCLNVSGRSEEALPLFQQAIRLNPLVSAYYRQLGQAYRKTKRYEEGIAAIKKSFKFAPNDILTNISLVALYMYAGREDEARAIVAEIYRIDPSFSLERYSKMLSSKEGPKKDRYIDALRKAGLK